MEQFPDPRNKPAEPLPLDVSKTPFVQKAVTNIVLANMNVSPDHSAVHLACGDHPYVPFILSPEPEEE